jgi:pyrroline-5-carboxylate reductase
MKIGIIGCGKMASAVICSLHSNSENIQFITYSATFKSAQGLADKVDGQAFTSMKELNDVDYILLGCKPQQIEIVSKEIKENLSLKNKTIISILAAVSIKRIQTLLDVDKVIRLMPSMPIAVNKGISLFYFSEGVKYDQQNFFVSLFIKSSQNFIMQTEEQFNQVTTISSSGPAYIYYLMSAFSKKLETYSLSSDDSRLLTSVLFEGASMMSQESNESLEDMINAVTSKAGVTIEAINTFKQLNLADSINKGIDKAYERSCNLEKSI